MGFAFYSPITKHTLCIFIVFFAFLCREPAMHPTGALVPYGRLCAKFLKFYGCCINRPAACTVRRTKLRFSVALRKL